MSLGVPGLALRNAWIDVDDERRLLAAIDAAPWSAELARRVQHYGYRYDYRGRNVDAVALGPLPSWAQALAQRLVDEGRFVRVPDQVIVNEYEPGQGISAHVDRDTFGRVVASLSLGSDVTMTLKERAAAGADADANDVRLERRSLLVLDRSARTRWTHAIAGRKSDVVAGARARVERTRRVSITFRTLAALDAAAAPLARSVDAHRAILHARIGQLDDALRDGLRSLVAAARAWSDVDFVQLELVEDVAADAFPILVLGKSRADGADHYTAAQSHDPRRSARETFELVREPLVHAALQPYYDNEPALDDDTLAACDNAVFEETSSWVTRCWGEVVGAAFPKAAYFIRMGDDADDVAFDLRAAREVTWSSMYE